MDLKSLKNNVNILKEEFVESSSEKDSMSSVISIEQNKIVELKEKLKSAKTENEKNEILEEIDNCKSCIREMESLLDEATMEKYTKEVLLTTEKEKLYGKEEKKTGKIEKIKTNESDKKEKNGIDNSIKNNFINLMNGKNVETDKVRGKVADSLFENESFSKEEIEEANKIAKIKKEGIFKKSIKNIKNFTRKIKGFIKSKINHAKPIKLGKNKKDEEKNKMPEVELKSVEPKSIVSKNKENKRVNVEKAEINTADAIRRMEEAAEIKFADEKENTK